MENLQDINNFLNEKRVTVKRRYTEKHPAKNVSTSARVRNAVFNAIADGHLTEEEINKILAEIKAHKAWVKRNSKLFNISEDETGIKRFSLSPYGQRVRNATLPINTFNPPLINEALKVPHKGPGKKPVNIFVGRFQPFTLGHVKVFEKMYKENGLPVVVFLVRGGKPDPEKRPFDEGMQQAMFAKMAKQYPFLETAIVVPNGAIDTLYAAARPTYEPMMWGYGTDRKKAYNSMIEKPSYREQLGVDPEFKGFEIFRTDDNISASKVRNALKIDDEKTFRKMTPKSIHKFYQTLQDVLEPIKENKKMKNLKSLNEYKKVNENVKDAAFNLDKIFGDDQESIETFQDIEDNGDWKDMVDYINNWGDEEMLQRYGIRNDAQVKKLAKHIMKESVLNEGAFPTNYTTYAKGKVTFTGQMWKDNATDWGQSERDIAEQMAGDLGLVNGTMYWGPSELNIEGTDSEGREIIVQQKGQFNMYGGPYTPQMRKFKVSLSKGSLDGPIMKAFKQQGWNLKDSGGYPDLSRTDIYGHLFPNYYFMQGGKNKMR